MSAVSTASEPELQKNTWSRSPGASAATRLRSSNALGWPNWKAGAKVELGGLLVKGLGDAGGGMPGMAAPQTGGGVKNRAAGNVVEMHVLGTGDEPRPLLEGAIGGKAHPESFEIVGRRIPTDGGDFFGLVHGLDL